MTLIAELDVPFEFVERPVTLPADMRPLWRIGVLILLIDKCRGQTASLEQLHVLNWAIRNVDAQDLFRSIMNNGVPPDSAIVRFDPTLPRAIAFGIAEKLCARNGNRLILTDKGRDFLSQMNADKDLLSDEKSFLASIKGKVTEKRIVGLLYPRVH